MTLFRPNGYTRSQLRTHFLEKTRPMGSLVKKRRKKMRRHKYRKMLKKYRRRNK